MIVLYKFIFLLFFTVFVHAQEVAILKYSGGGDWYANPTAVKNLIEFSNANIKTTIKTLYPPPQHACHPPHNTHHAPRTTSSHASMSAPRASSTFITSVLP